MKKLLLLGGSTQQIPAIEYANKQGYHSVLCDYLPDNPGQHYAKSFYCVSTTDREAILEVAKKEKIDGILAYASDPAAPTAAYVAEKLGLPTNSYEAVEILASKDKFRKFLTDKAFSCPQARSFSSLEDARKSIEQFALPAMVKPIDSSGSKGVSKLEKYEGLESAYDEALKYSRKKKIIIEEFLEKDHAYMIGGDCFLVDGKVEFWGLLNSYRNEALNPYVPIGTSYPLLLSEARIDLLKIQTQKLFDLLDIRQGAFNIEIIFDKQDKLYFIEMGPRNGGNMISELLHLAYGEDLIAASVETAMGNGYKFTNLSLSDEYLTTYVLHSLKDGVFASLNFKNNIEDHIEKIVMYKEKGDRIQYFDGANKALGIAFLSFNSQDELVNFMQTPEKWIEVLVDQVRE